MLFKNHIQAFITFYIFRKPSYYEILTKTDCAVPISGTTYLFF